ncbi:hypothetical protein D3C85_1052850 [compost metagenome]
MAPYRMLHGLLDLLLDAHIRGDEVRAQLISQALAGLDTDVRKHEFRPFAGKQLCSPGAYATGSAGNEHHFILEALVHRILSSVRSIQAWPEGPMKLLGRSRNTLAPEAKPPAVRPESTTKVCAVTWAAASLAR